MQTQECKGLDVKRNMDLLRLIEEDDQLDGTSWISSEHFHIEGRTPQEIAYHLTMLSNEGFITAQLGMEMPLVSKLTWNGHEFLDDTRDPGVWEKTKERAKGLTGIGVAFIWELAKAEIRTRLGL
jgi:hypothetical protein